MATEQPSEPTTASRPISKKHLFVRDGIFKAELDEFLKRELAEDGYSGVIVRKSKTCEIIIIATRPSQVLGEKSRRIRELTSIVNKRWGREQGQMDLFVERVANRGLCAIAQAESLRYKLLGGLAVRRAAYGVLRFVMESGAKGCEVVISGKIRGQRAKAMKFVDGMMIHSGYPVREYVDTAVRHVLLRQGVLGIKVKILKPHDETGKDGPTLRYPDIVTIMDPKEEVVETNEKAKHA
jgi:small subunit ribosomal protein S3e